MWAPMYIRQLLTLHRIAEQFYLSSTAVVMVQKLFIFIVLVAAVQAVVVPAPAYPYAAPAYAHGPLPAYAHGPLPAYAHGPLPAYAHGPLLPAIAKVAKVAVPEPYDPNPQYSFSYDVHDASTGDVKSQQEHRQGDVVQGSYSLIEPDGTKRLVEYTADPVHGFNAVVHREPVAVKAVAKVLAPAPLLAKVAYTPAIAKVPAYGGYPAAYPHYG